jgi:hypothetical protein
LQSSLDNVLQSNFSDVSLKLLHVFPLCTLRKPLRGRKRRNRRSLTEFSKELLNRWINGEHVLLFTECLDEYYNASNNDKPSSESSPSAAQNLRRAAYLLQKSRISDAVKALSFKGYDCSENVYETLLSKHPPRSENTPDDLLTHFNPNLLTESIQLHPGICTQSITELSRWFIRWTFWPLSITPKTRLLHAY